MKIQGNEKAFAGGGSTGLMSAGGVALLLSWLNTQYQLNIPLELILLAAGAIGSIIGIINAAVVWYVRNNAPGLAEAIGAVQDGD